MARLFGGPKIFRLEPFEGPRSFLTCNSIRLAEDGDDDDDDDDVEDDDVNDDDDDDNNDESPNNNRPSTPPAAPYTPPFVDSLWQSIGGEVTRRNAPSANPANQQQAGRQGSTESNPTLSTAYLRNMYRYRCALANHPSHPIVPRPPINNSITIDIPSTLCTAEEWALKTFSEKRQWIHNWEKKHPGVNYMLLIPHLQALDNGVGEVIDRRREESVRLHHELTEQNPLPDEQQLDTFPFSEHPQLQSPTLDSGKEPDRTDGIDRHTLTARTLWQYLGRLSNNRLDSMLFRMPISNLYNLIRSDPPSRESSAETVDYNNHPNAK